MANNIDTLVEQLGKLTVIEAGELSKKLEKAWGLNLDELMNKPQVAVAEEKAEASLFNVNLIGFDAGKKIGVIKAIRAFKDMGLLEAKNFVEESIEKPQEIKSDLDKAEADKVKTEIETAGGKVEVK